MSTDDGTDLMELAERVREEWADDPNVVGVGFGVKETEGKEVEGPALRFVVREKLDTDEEIEDAGSRPIPEEIEGVLTDVVVVEGKSTEFPVGARGTAIEEPLKGGVSTSVLGDFLPFPTGYGTLGAVCFHDDTAGNTRLMALSNAHVWGDEIGDDIVQPFVPVSEFLEAGVKLLTCGPFVSYLSEGQPPSGLTSVLTAAAGAAWIAAAASDEIDPHRRGQEATPPASSAERTEAEYVQFAAEPKEIPLPGHPYSADVTWSYQRQTDQNTYNHGVNETRTNEHVLVRKDLWTERREYEGGDEVEIVALLESARVERPDGFHVVAHLTPDDSDRRVSRVLHPASCRRSWRQCIDFTGNQPDAQASFPFDQDGVDFDASDLGYFRDDWPPASAPDGQVELQFPGDGIEMRIPPSRAARAHVYEQSRRPIVLEGYDSDGTLVGQDQSPGHSGKDHTLTVKAEELTHLRLYGGASEGLLIQLCLDLLERREPTPTSPENEVFCYRGRYTLDPGESPGSWRGMVSAQTVNTAGRDLRPEQAATNIGGIEEAELVSSTVSSAAGCALVLALDDLFDVI